VAFRGSPVSKFENSAISEVVSTTSLQEILPAQLALGTCSGSDFAPSRKGPNLQSFYGVITGQNASRCVGRLVRHDRNGFASSSIKKQWNNLKIGSEFLVNCEAENSRLNVLDSNCSPVLQSPLCIGPIALYPDPIVSILENILHPMEAVHTAPLMLATIRHNSGYQLFFIDLAHSTSPNDLRERKMAFAESANTKQSDQTITFLYPNPQLPTLPAPSSPAASPLPSTAPSFFVVLAANEPEPAPCSLPVPK
jgi:hypothetical protein